MQRSERNDAPWDGWRVGTCPAARGGTRRAVIERNADAEWVAEWRSGRVRGGLASGHRRQVSA